MLVGQKALITGTSSGIGRAVAIRLGAAGADVVVNDIGGEDAAQAAVDEIRANGAKAMAITADVSDEAQEQVMSAETIESFGTIDLLVNNPVYNVTPRNDLRDADDQECRAGGRGSSHPSLQHLPGRDPRADQPRCLGTAEAYHELMNQIPYNRIGEPDEIARAAVWLAFGLRDRWLRSARPSARLGGAPDARWREARQTPV